MGYQGYLNSKTSNNFPIALCFAKGLVQANRQDLDEISQTVPRADYHQLQHFVTNSHWWGEMLINEMVLSTQRSLKGKERLLIIDEVGQPKKGNNSVAVARQSIDEQGGKHLLEVPCNRKIYLKKTYVNNPKKRGDKAETPSIKRLTSHQSL